MRRGVGPPAPVVPVPVQPVTSAFPQCSTDLLQRMGKTVRLSGGPGKLRGISQFIEWQPQIDGELFCFTSDNFHMSKLTPLQRFQLLEILARFFKEKSEDPHRYTYFEIIFLGREGDEVLHERRLEILYNFASYALQYPVLSLFTSISQWLTKKTTPRIYAEKLVSHLVEHFIKVDSVLKMYEFLLPLDTNYSEFVTLFVTLAHKTVAMNDALAIVCGTFMQTNLKYMVNQFRDETWMAEEFARELFPKFLAYILKIDSNIKDDEKIRALSCLCAGLLPIMQYWNTKIKDIQLDAANLFDNAFSWTAHRADLIILYGKMSAENHKKVLKFADNSSPPVWVITELEKEFAPLIPV